MRHVGHLPIKYICHIILCYKYMNIGIKSCYKSNKTVIMAPYDVDMFLATVLSYVFVHNGCSLGASTDVFN